MKKVYISYDESFPDFYIEEDENFGIGEEAIIPDEKLKWIKRVEKEYNQVQAYLREIYNNINKEGERL